MDGQRWDDDPASPTPHEGGAGGGRRADELVIEVADTRSVVRCPACGYKTKKVHETRKVEVEDIPSDGPSRRSWPKS